MGDAVKKNLTDSCLDVARVLEEIGCGDLAKGEKDDKGLNLHDAAPARPWENVRGRSPRLAPG